MNMKNSTRSKKNLAIRIPAILLAGLMSLPASIGVGTVAVGTVAGTGLFFLSAGDADATVRSASRRTGRRTARRTSRRVSTLPRGYRTVMVGGVPYYYVNNIYYERVGNVYVEVVFD